MTREEAIRWLEYSKDHYEGLDFGAPRIALDMAISALGEQEEKEPCEACQFFEDAREQDFGLYEKVVFEFCPVCGRRLEEV